jgi:hypothetical protein
MLTVITHDKNKIAPGNWFNKVIFITNTNADMNRSQ